MLRRLLLFAAGVLAAVAALEILFQLLPTSTATRSGYYIDPDIRTYPPGMAFRTSFGWELDRPQAQRANNFGFVAEREFVADRRAVALIGDSYVEASMLAPGERLAAQLERARPGRPVYAMGAPGSSLLDYVERVRFAAAKLDVEEFVIVVERGDVMQSLCGSGNVHAPCLDPSTLAARTERQSAAQGWLVDALRRSALAQYLFTQLRVSPGAWLARLRGLFASRPSAAVAPAAGQDERAAHQAQAVLDAFFERLEPYRDRRFTLVVGGRLEPAARPDPVRELLMTRARRWGARVVDTEPLFGAHARRSPLSLAVSPRDAHWNGLAIGLIAAAVAAEQERQR